MYFEVSKDRFNRIIKSNSIVDTLDIMGLDSSLEARQTLYKIFKLSTEKELPGGWVDRGYQYSGTAEQNTELRRVLLSALIIKK